jgi:hypothetical protein
MRAIGSTCRGNDSDSLNVEHPYRMKTSHGLHPVTSPVIQNVRSLANRQNLQKLGSSGNAQCPPAKRRVSVPAGERDSVQRGSSVASTLEG